jgi:3-methyladenine DNA glycosylase AlkD
MSKMVGMMNSKAVKAELRKLAKPQKAEIFKWFFKTKEGEYGFGDKFIGITVPEMRMVSKQFINLDLKEIESLLQSEIHEDRLTALFILVLKFKKEKLLREEIYNLYLKNTKFINNWDLVDSSADKIVGAFLLEKPRQVLYQLAKSSLVWDRRIAIVSTYQFIRANQFEDTLKISELLLNDPHDLIHKAVGWMLREVGKKSKKDLENFLNKHYQQMPRTMLRYSIEHFQAEIRQKYLHGQI